MKNLTNTPVHLDTFTETKQIVTTLQLIFIIKKTTKYLLMLQYKTTNDAMESSGTVDGHTNRKRNLISLTFFENSFAGLPLVKNAPKIPKTKVFG